MTWKQIEIPVTEVRRGDRIGHSWKVEGTEHHPFEDQVMVHARTPLGNAHTFDFWETDRVVMWREFPMPDEELEDNEDAYRNPNGEVPF